jgi:hypothetical protein
LCDGWPEEFKMCDMNLAIHLPSDLRPAGNPDADFSRAGNLATVFPIPGAPASMGYGNDMN